MTDNGSCYRGPAHALACRHARHPAPAHAALPARTNGKAERFIRTMLGGWAYGAIYNNSAERTRALPGWLDFYNHQRLDPHVPGPGTQRCAPGPTSSQPGAVVSDESWSNVRTE